MPRLPWKSVLVTLGAVASVTTAVWASGALTGETSEPADLSEPAVADSVQAVAATEEPQAGKTALEFTFLDPAIVPVPDERPNSYSFRIQDQNVGVIALTPGGEGGEAPSSFAEWFAGIGETIEMSGQKVPVQRLRVADRDALAFTLQTESDVAENLMVEIDGRVLWLQTRAARDYLTRFVEKVAKIEAN